MPGEYGIFVIIFFGSIIFWSFIAFVLIKKLVHARKSVKSGESTLMQHAKKTLIWTLIILGSLFFIDLLVEFFIGPE